MSVVDTIQDTNVLELPLGDSEVSSEANSCKTEHTYETKVSAIHMRVYAEMFGAPDGTDGDEAVEILHMHLSRISSIPRGQFFVDAAIHDMDYSHDDVLNPSPIKVHGHICLMVEGRKADGRPKQLSLGSIMRHLERFIGLRYRLEYPGTVVKRKKTEFGNFIDVERPGKPSDAADFREFQAIKKLRMGDSTSPDSLSAMVAYLDHDTFDAREEGKYLYLPIGSNPYRYSNDVEFSRVLMARYHKSQDYERTKGKIVLSRAEWKMWLKDEAYDLGKRGGNCMAWYKSLPSTVQCGDYDKIIDKWYKMGADEYLQSDVGINNVRCCIFIQGAKDLGKTHNSSLALRSLGLNVLEIDGGKTGKFDNLTTDTGGLVVSDTGLSDYFACLDDKFCYLYRRNCNNPLWCGKYLIITFNGTFDQYMSTFAHDMWDSDNMTFERKEALKSRLYLCTCYEDGLHIDVKADRGSDDKQDIRDGLFLDFYDRFQAFQQEYMKHKKDKGKHKGANTLRLDTIMSSKPNEFHQMSLLDINECPFT